MAIELFSYSVVRDLVTFLWKRFGPGPEATEAAATEPGVLRWRPARARRSAVVPFGYRAALVDGGVVQRQLGPGVYRPWHLRRLRRRHNLSATAELVAWHPSAGPEPPTRDEGRATAALASAGGAERLQELLDEDRLDQAVSAVMQDRALRQKALARELEAADFDLVMERVRRAARLQEAIAACLASVKDASDEAAAPETAAFLAHVGRAEWPDLAPSEREQLRRIVEAQTTAVLPLREAMAAVAGGLAISPAAVDPLRTLCGLRTMGVGETWRVFDGETFWRMSLRQVVMGRNGWRFWQQRPVRGMFAVVGLGRGRQNGRRSEQAVDFRGSGRLHLGVRSLEIELDHGGASAVTVWVSSDFASS